MCNDAGIDCNTVYNTFPDNFDINNIGPDAVEVQNNNG
jgi:hypothetical protein